MKFVGEFRRCCLCCHLRPDASRVFSRTSAQRTPASGHRRVTSRREDSVSFLDNTAGLSSSQTGAVVMSDETDGQRRAHCRAQAAGRQAEAGPAGGAAGGVTGGNGRAGGAGKGVGTASDSEGALGVAGTPAPHSANVRDERTHCKYVWGRERTKMYDAHLYE